MTAMDIIQYPFIRVWIRVDTTSPTLISDYPHFPKVQETHFPSKNQYPIVSRYIDNSDNNDNIFYNNWIRHGQNADNAQSNNKTRFFSGRCSS